MVAAGGGWRRGQAQLRADRRRAGGRRNRCVSRRGVGGFTGDVLGAAIVLAGHAGLVVAAAR